MLNGEQRNLLHHAFALEPVSLRQFSSNPDIRNVNPVNTAVPTVNRSFQPTLQANGKQTQIPTKQSTR